MLRFPLTIERNHNHKKTQMRKPTTNPKINGKPMSFVRVPSAVAGQYGGHGTSFTDSRGVPYVRDDKGTVRRSREPIVTDAEGHRRDKGELTPC